MGPQEIRKVSKLYRRQPSSQSSCQNENFVNTSKKVLFRSALFHMITRVSLKWFVNHFRSAFYMFWKQSLTKMFSCLTWWGSYRTAILKKKHSFYYKILPWITYNYYTLFRKSNSVKAIEWNTLITCKS